MNIKLEQNELESIQEHLGRLIELSNLVKKANSEIETHRRDLELAWKSVCQRHMLETKDYEFQAPTFIDNMGSTNISLKNDIARIPEELIPKAQEPKKPPNEKPIIVPKKKETKPAAKGKK